MRNNFREIQILYEDKDLIVCVKPSGVPSQSDKTSDYDMVNRLKNYIFENSDCNGEPYIGLVHRLDRPVGGVMVFAKNERALKSLNEQIRTGKMKKRYLAVSDAHNIVQDDQWHNLKDYMLKDAKTNTSSIVDKSNKNAKLSELNYKIIEQVKDANNVYSLIEVELLTGRHHQIRVQLSNKNMALWGDTKYNKDFQKRNPHLKWANIALFAYRLEFLHPSTNKKMVFENKPSEDIFSQFEFVAANKFK